jgi:two-component system sensor kinase FixL
MNEATGTPSEGREPRERALDFIGFADASTDFICLATTHGKPFYLNRAAREMLGLDPAAALSDASLHDFYDEASWAELRDVAVPAVNEVGRWEGRSQLRHAVSGELLPALTTVFAVRRPGAERASCLAIVHRDARAWLQLEDALAEARARKRAILESALDPIITVDHDGRIIEYNRAAELAFGHPRDKVLGTRPADLLFPPEKAPGQQDRIDRYLAVGEGSMLGRRGEVTAVRANGETFPAELAMTISQEGGAPVLSFFIRDLGPQKEIAAQQARYAAELERSNQDLQQFAYVASHDLQEPLRKIRTFSDRLESHCREQLDDTGRECIDRMQGAAVRMQTLIDGLLSLSRVATGGREFVPVSLAEVVAEVVADLEVQIERVHGRVEVGNLPTIQADPLQMRQLFQNLIGNALKFHRSDEPPLVTIEGRQDGPRPKRGAAGGAGACRIVVSDNGIGFDQRDAERIFGVFQRLNPRAAFEGTGIGLAICRRIVERHGGTISARAAPGRGSVFEVVLPVRQAPPPRPKAAADDAGDQALFDSGGGERS